MAGTDPTPFIVSAIDLKRGETALYIRGNDMANFPSKEVVSALMPIKLLPYTSGISSSQLRHAIRSSISVEADDVEEESVESGSSPESSAQSTSSFTSSASDEPAIKKKMMMCSVATSMDTTASSEESMLMRAEDEVFQLD